MDLQLTSNLNKTDLEGYLIECSPTAASHGGALLYITKNINFKLRNNLEIYKYKELTIKRHLLFLDMDMFINISYHSGYLEN